MKKNNALIIGANGGIGQEVVQQLCSSNNYDRVYTVARKGTGYDYPQQTHSAFDTSNASLVDEYINRLKHQNVEFSLIVCCSGVLHQSSPEPLKPERRLEEIDAQQLAEYFRINSILPAIWLKNLIKVVDKKSSKIVIFSARVGSISDNKLGGWYGYRASKAALNMLVKTAAIEYKRRAPKTALVCYHPGTVDTDLSKPFQTNIKPDRLFTSEFTVTQLLDFLSKLDPNVSPHYMDWNGETINW